MCGIAGWVDFDRDLSTEAATVRRMTEHLHRRGPDGHGTYVSERVLLGHRRLCVIDPAGAAQPMTARRGPHAEPVVLTYNGEIYNFRQLRAELSARGHRFETRSDTEVVLRAYLHWGEDAVTHLTGMFAFAVWDGDRRELLLARDRIGIKPLYYHQFRNGVVFGSEPKSVLANPLFTARVNEQSLPALFNSRFTPPGETPLVGLAEVRPGHVVRFSADGRRERRYWSLTSAPHTHGLRETVSTVRELLETIVDDHLVADVPLCSLLSGGLDSSALAALAVRSRTARGGANLATFSVDFADSAADFRPTPLRPERDSPYAWQAAHHLGTEHREVVVDTDRMLAALPAARAARDLPSLGQFDASMLELYRSVRETSTVALSGEAADEMFGGYPWFHDPATVWSDTFPWAGASFRLTDVLLPDLRDRIRPEDQERDLYKTLLAEVPRLTGETGVQARMREVLYLSMQAPLGLLLDRNDRVGMAVGLEVRVPFCDHRLVEYLWNVPWSMHTADGREKSLLRAAVADLLPAPILDRPKSAYPASFDAEYAASVLASLRAIMADPDSPLAALVDHDRLRDVSARAGRPSMVHANQAHALIPLIEVDRWLRDYRVTVV